MSRAANGDFGGKRRPAPDGHVGFDVYPDGEEYIATGDDARTDD